MEVPAHKYSNGERLSDLASGIVFASACGNMRVLLVDDDPLVLWSLHQSLTAAGHVVTQTGSGNEALSLLQADSFDIVLTDLKLPGADGFKVVEASRTLSPNIPVIMISAHGKGDFQEKIRTYGIHFIDKPFNVNEVVRLAENLCHPRKT